MDNYAVIETGGKQYRIKQGDVLDVETLEGEVGKKVAISRVLAVSDGKALKVGQPEIAGGSVTASVVAQFRGRKVIAFKKKRRKGYHKKIGHRQDLTKIKVEEIKVG